MILYKNYIQIPYHNRLRPTRTLVGEMIHSIACKLFVIPANPPSGDRRGDPGMLKL